MSDLLLENVRLTAGGQPAAVGVSGGRIVAVGAPSEVLPHLPRPAPRIDGNGGYVFPGFSDAHTHLLFTGLQAVGDNLRLYGVRSIAEMVELVRAAAEDRPPGSWITGFGWNESLLAEGRLPSRWDLDTATQAHPVLLHRVWNTCVANSAALAAAGVDRRTAARYPAGRYAGSIQSDRATSEPTGIFTKRAKAVVEAALPDPTEAEMESAILDAQERYLRAGICAIIEPGLLPRQLEAYRRLDEQGLLKLRVRACPAGWGWPMLPDPGGSGLTEDLERLADLRASLSGRPHLRLDAVKMMVDGGVTDRSALMHQPYVGGGLGELLLSPATLEGAISWCWRHDWPVDLHVCGDAALDLVLDVCSRLARNSNPAGSRVHHAYFLDATRAEQLPAGMTVVANPVFLESEGASYVEALGRDRAERMMPLRSLVEAGVPLAFGSDSPGAPYEPLLGIRAALDRGAVSGCPLGLDQALDLHTAVEVATLGGAQTTREGDDRGTVAPGRLADLILLDAPLGPPWGSLPAVTLALVGGVVAYAADRVAPRDSTDPAGGAR